MNGPAALLRLPAALHRAFVRGAHAAASPAAVRAALLACAALLAFAWLAPAPIASRRVFDGVVVIDITQSMNTLDALRDGPPMSRLALAKAKLRDALAQLPCGTRLGWGVFTEYRSAMLLLPVEVCSNYGELAAVLDRIGGPMAWAGGSEISRGLMSALRLSAHSPGHPSIVFITDGHEAPPLRADYVARVPDDATDPRGMILGVGGDALRPIPKSGQNGEPLGLWGPKDVLQAPPTFPSDAPGEANPPAVQEGTEHLSSLKQDHLRALAQTTGLGYARLTQDTDMAAVLQDAHATRRLPVPLDLRAPLAASALALLLFAIGPVRWHAAS